MAVLFLAGTCELRSWSAQRERERERERGREGGRGGGGGNGVWAWAYSGRTYLNPLNHFSSSASTSPCLHALSRFFSRLSPEWNCFLYFSLFLRIFDSVVGGICCSSVIAFFSLWGLASTSSISLIFLLCEIDSLGFESAILTGVWQRSEAGFTFSIPAIKKGKEGAYRHLP